MEQDDLIKKVKDNGYSLFLLFLLVIVIVGVLQFGRIAPKFLMALSIALTLMVMPFFTGFAGFSITKKGWFAVLAGTLLLAATYQVVYHENILRFWYLGEFDRKYICGLLQAGTIVPGISFLVGLAVRIFSSR